ncbi:hypothetical protein SB768_33880, partial [Burkholderia sp. SIMBA_043]|uniref:hypothetical protein n=1 Tax=Burkholderia sp. SIMBA_043 TaxID=3085784 RepID=UPI00397BF11C
CATRPATRSDRAPAKSTGAPATDSVASRTADRAAWGGRPRRATTAGFAVTAPKHPPERTKILSDS